MSATSLKCLQILNIGHYMGLSPYRLHLIQKENGVFKVQIVSGNKYWRLLSTLLTGIIVAGHIGLIAFIIAYDVLGPKQSTPNRITALILNMMAVACTTLQIFFLTRNNVIYFMLRNLFGMIPPMGTVDSFLNFFSFFKYEFLENVSKKPVDELQLYLTAFISFQCVVTATISIVVTIMTDRDMHFFSAGKAIITIFLGEEYLLGLGFIAAAWTFLCFIEFFYLFHVFSIILTTKFCSIILRESIRYT
jgi:hypothetical protein